MKKYSKLILSIGISLLLVLLLGEGKFRFVYQSDSEEIRYKKFHCLYGFSEIRLCPNRNETFTRKDGKTWDIQTNHRGERILSDEKEDTNLWIIGDSMAMGYGLPTKETLAFYLKTKYNLNARVIAVDAIGTNGISRLLKETLTGTKEENHPKKIFWIWNPSDFIDDEREKTGLKRFLYPIHHLLSRYSYTYRYFLPSPPNNVYTSYGTPILYPKEHITYSNLFQFLNDPSISKEKLSILFSLGMSREGKPDTSDPNYDETKKFFIQEGMNTIDLRKKTEELFKEQKQIYIPGDGHPGPALAELFADAIASEFLNLQ